MELDKLKQALECLLFVTAEPLSNEKLVELTGNSKAEVKYILAQLQEDYAQRGFHLRSLAGGWQFSTEGDFAPLIEKLYHPKIQQLSAAAMETLAIVAYKQPITRAEISTIRRVEADGVIANLLDKRLIKEVGRRVNAGRAILYGTSDEFLSFFGLSCLEDLPQMLTPVQQGQMAVGQSIEQLSL
ncbi:MAG: SMC-Scp complex subunit ScpB [Clostridiales bacterium]